MATTERAMVQAEGATAGGAVQTMPAQSLLHGFSRITMAPDPLAKVGVAMNAGVDVDSASVNGRSSLFPDSRRIDEMRASTWVVTDVQEQRPTAQPGG